MASLIDLVNNLIIGTSIQPDVAAVAAATTNGDYVDMRGAAAPVHGYFAIGAVGGSPTSFTVTCTLREADDTAGLNEGAVAEAGTSTLVLTADDANGFVRGLRARRQVRCRVVTAFTGGTSPTIALFAAVMSQDKSF